MADPVISYKRLSHAWSAVVDALNFLIGNINKDATWSGNKFVTTDGSGKMTAQGGWATSAPPQASGAGGAGIVNEVARRDHYHPNTCPDLTPASLGNEIANKSYVDNGTKSYIHISGKSATMNLSSTEQVVIYDTVEVSKDMTYNQYGEVTVAKAGKYRVSFYGSYELNVGATVTAIVNKVNSDTSIGSKGTRAGGQSLVVSGGASGILDIGAGEKVFVRISASTSAVITHHFAGFIIESV